jgi:hypothetical protein
MKRATLMMAVVVLLFGGVGQARAGMITYTETFTASGSFTTQSGTTPFTTAQVTLSGTGDTANIVGGGPGSLFNVNLTTTVTVAGIGPGGSNVTATFTDGTNVAVHQMSSVAGFDDATSRSNIAFTSNSLFATYGLTTSIAPPVSGSLTDNPTNHMYNTTQGTLTFTSFGSTSTFGATLVTPAPEPSTLTLLGLGSLGLLGYGWRRRKQATA